MAISSVDRQIQLLRKHERPQNVLTEHIPELGLTVTSEYDSENDALSFDFGLNEPTFELPEGDGSMVWKIGRHSGSVAGFTILEPRRFGIAQVRIDIKAVKERKDAIERGLRRVPHALALGRATRVLIESVAVTASSSEEAVPPSAPSGDDAFQKAIEAFRRRFLDEAAPAQETASV
jgi:hypothetical protein